MARICNDAWRTKARFYVTGLAERTTSAGRSGPNRSGAGLNYDVSLSTRNAASLRGQFLDTANADWKLRENVAT